MPRLASPIRRNDNVVVTTGKDRGKRGRILKVICPECGKPSRLGRKRLDDGRGVRVCKNCDATFS